MKRRIVTIVILLSALVCVFFVLYLRGTFTEIYSFVPQRGVEISGNPVNNDFNNMLAGGNLARVEDKLYYIYGETIYPPNGVICIDSNIARKITLPKEINSLSSTFLHKIEDSLYLSNYREADNIFELTKKRFEKVDFIGSDEIGLYKYSILDTIIYCEEYPKVYGTSLNVYEGGETTCIESDCVGGFYPYNGYVFYTWCPENGNHEIRKYDVATKEKTIVYKANNSYLGNSIYIVEGFVFITLRPYGESEDLYLFDLDGNTEPQVIFQGDNKLFGLNVYDGQVYIAHRDDGIYVYNIGSRETTLIYEGDARRCYILDDKWIYFEDSYGGLWRITQHGQDLEKVFRWRFNKGGTI